ncbi:MAG: hypothetical protein WCH43_06680 [Verrucomicrobiota bacterium]
MSPSVSGKNPEPERITPTIEKAYNHITARLAIVVCIMGYGQCMSIADLARIVMKESGSSSQIIHSPERAGAFRHSQASSWRRDGSPPMAS